MDVVKLLRYARLILKAHGKHSPRDSAYADEMILVEETKQGVRILGWTIPRGRVLLDWRRVVHDFGDFKETDEIMPEEEAHIQKLVLLDAMAAGL